MTKEALLHKTVETLSKLSGEQLKEVSDFAEFILKKYEDDILIQGIEKLTGQSKAYDFLRDDTAQYTLEDLKEKY